MRAHDMGSILAAGKFATRKAYGLALRALGQANSAVVALDADVSNSTFAEMFAKDPSLSNRFVECKIAEQNMISVAAGISAAGKVPFVSTFAKFVTRAYDQIEMAILSGANIKVVGSHAGVSLAADGPSQMGLPDIAWFRSFTTVKDHRGNPAATCSSPPMPTPRTRSRSRWPSTRASATCGPSAPRSSSSTRRRPRVQPRRLRRSSAKDATAARRLRLHGARGQQGDQASTRPASTASLVDLYSLPFDADALLDLAAANNGYVVTVEDNYGASIGSAVADVFAGSGDGFTVKQMHVNTFPKSSRSAEEALKMTGLDVPSITRQCLQLLEVGVV